MNPSLHHQTSSGQERIGLLDSIRGLASLAVLLGHSLAVCAWDRSITTIPLISNIFDGRSAVTMFFVLSGFVLSLRFFQETGRKLRVGPFFARRITRIWIPWFAFFLISAFFHKIRPNLPTIDPPLTDHHLMVWSSPYSALDVLFQLFFRLHDASKMLLPQDWSLGIELRASLFIPLFILISRNYWFGCIAFALAFWILKPQGGYYYASFAIGTTAALLHAKYLRSHSLKVSGSVMFLAGSILYQIRWVYDCTEWLPPQIQEKDVWMISAVGCGLLILGCLRFRPVRSLLEQKAFIWLGAVSYSLFLVQVIVLVCLGPWVVFLLNSAGIGADHSLLIPSFILIIVAVCLALACLGERYIEIPAIRMGQMATRALEKTRIGRLSI